LLRTTVAISVHQIAADSDQALLKCRRIFRIYNGTESVDVPVDAFDVDRCLIERSGMKGSARSRS
jgi:hypothetical protein